MAFEKPVLSIVAYGLYLTCVTSIAFNIHARRAHGLFAMKCITMCSDTNIWHFKHRFIYTNNIALIQIIFKVNMRFFFLSVYFLPFYRYNMCNDNYTWNGTVTTRHGPCVTTIYMNWGVLCAIEMLVLIVAFFMYLWNPYTKSESWIQTPGISECLHDLFQTKITLFLLDGSAICTFPTIRREVLKSIENIAMSCTRALHTFCPYLLRSSWSSVCPDCSFICGINIRQHEDIIESNGFIFRFW